MNLTYIGIDLTRHLRNVSNLMFTLLLPVAMYIIFGATASYGDESVGNANSKFYVMASMAAYGAALATTSTAANAASEAMLGWGRQLSLTRQPFTGYVLNKVVVAVALASVAVAIVFVAGALTGAKADSWWIWLATYGIILGGSVIFALFGLAVGLLFNSETATGIASGALVFLAFFGNMFLPLSGTMLDIARFTPMYGYASLSRWPATEGWLSDATRDNLTWSVVNFVAWLVIFGTLAVLAGRKARTRQ